MEGWALLFFFVVYFVVTFAWRSWHVWRRTGINPYVLPNGDDTQAFLARAFRIVLMTMGLYVSGQVLWPVHNGFGTLEWLDAAPVHAAGWTLLLVSLAWIFVAQAQMGLSWRIGIDTARDTALVQTGLFSCSRNPIFLAMRASLLGLLLVRPDAITLTIAVAGEILMQLQVREEEAFLLRKHGSAYTDYCARTPRWL